MPEGLENYTQEHGRCLKIYNYTTVHSVPLAPLHFLPSPPSFIILPSSSLLFSRLCRVWRRDQAGSVSPGVGEAVARQLLPMSDVQHGPHGRVHQQVSSAKGKRLSLREKTHRYTCKLRFTHYSVFLFFFFFCSLCLRDGVPYCEADYHAQYGVKCETCSRYISGRVLEVRTGDQISTPNGVNVGI